MLEFNLPKKSINNSTLVHSDPPRGCLLSFECKIQDTDSQGCPEAHVVNGQVDLVCVDAAKLQRKQMCQKKLGCLQSMHQNAMLAWGKQYTGETMHKSKSVLYM